MALAAKPQVTFAVQQQSSMVISFMSANLAAPASRSTATADRSDAAGTSNLQCVR